jgi:hypothetical protein
MLPGRQRRRLGAIASHVVVSGAAPAASPPFVPALELTTHQPPPVAANGGVSYLQFDVDGDAGTQLAVDHALEQIATGAGAELLRKIEEAPAGGIDTKWGTGFRRFGECLEAIRQSGVRAPEGGMVVPLRYTVMEMPSYSVVSSHSLWRDPARAAEHELFRRDERENGLRALYFPQVVRDARRIAEYRPGLDPSSPECMDRLGVSLTRHHSACRNFYDHGEVERIYYPEIEQLLLDFFPGAVDALVYNHDVFDKDYQGERAEDQGNKNPGVNSTYANLVHNDLNDNSGRVRCRELLTRNLRNFGRRQSYTEAEADEKMARRFMSINLAQPMETVQQNPFILCAWPSFAKQPYINNYRIYDDRVGETTRFTHRPDHEWYWLPQQRADEVSMLKCYDSVTDGSVSRWSFHTACIDPSLPRDAPCRRNIVVRSFVFFDQ